MRDCSYIDRLSLLRLYSLQRRRERNCIIYVWKIIEGLVPNFSKPIVCTHSERRGRYCVVSHVNIGRSGTLAGALILEHVSEIMADTCNVNTRQKKILNKLQNNIN